MQCFFWFLFYFRLLDQTLRAQATVTLPRMWCASLIVVHSQDILAHFLVSLTTFLVRATAINGGWSPWVDGTCSATCGSGTMTQTRTCNNPSPANGGSNCATNQAGDTQTDIPCNTNACPSEIACSILVKLKYWFIFFIKLGTMLQSRKVLPLQPSVPGLAWLQMMEPNVLPCATRDVKKIWNA